MWLVLQRENKYKNENIYRVDIDVISNIVYCRVCWGLWDREMVKEVGGEWFGPLKAPI